MATQFMNQRNPVPVQANLLEASPLKSGHHCHGWAKDRDFFFFFNAKKLGDGEQSVFVCLCFLWTIRLLPLQGIIDLLIYPEQSFHCSQR